jgi:hypothetical protein
VPRALTSLVVAAVVVVVVAGCSGDDRGDGVPPPSAAPSSAVPAEGSAVTDDLVALYVGDSPDPQDRSDGRCFADELQSRLDPAQLTAAGIVGADGEVVDVLPVFDPATAESWVDAQLACVDYVEVSTRALLTQTRGGLDAEAYADCLRGALTDTEVRAALVQTLSGGFDSPEVAALADAQAACVG